LEKEKIRFYALARELKMESKDLLDLCQRHGVVIKNQLSGIDPDLRDTIVKLVKEQQSTSSAPAAPRAATAPPVLPPKRPQVIGKGHTLPARETEPSPAKTVPPPAPTTSAPPAVAPPQEKSAIPAPLAPPPPAKQPETPPPPPRVPETVPPAPTRPAATETKAPETPRAPERPVEAPKAPKAPEQPAAQRPAETPPPTQPAPVVRPPVVRPPMGNVPNLGGGPRPGGGGEGGTRTPRVRPPLRPSTVQRAVPPPSLRPQKPVETKKPAAQNKPTGATKLLDIPPELMREGGVTIEKIAELQQQQQRAARGHGPAGPVPEIVEEEEEGGKGKGGARRGAPGGPGSVAGRDARHKSRAARQKERATEVSNLKGGRVATVLDRIDEDTPRRHKLSRGHQRVRARPTEERKGKVPIDMPITVRSLSEAIGVKSGNLIFELMANGAPPTTTINSVIDPVMAETIALGHNRELDIKKAHDTESTLVAESQKADKPEDLVPRAPIVAVMGHVDHGKTSLLDRIRREYGIKSDVVSTEAGGITQVIRAWRVEKNGKPITFLDTPGHEAFTKMRARGANVTDIAVIVVAVDDGVMPQTEEAINHAKAAGVSIVVALNKVDLPNANIRKAEQQLYGLNVLPDNMGGDSPFVQTSAATGKGIDELLDSIDLVAEIKELKANPNKPASGTCLEANLSEGEGVFATLLVREGTLHRGDVLLCGATYGRVRAMYDDMGRPIEEATPSVPCRITGLDEVPNADDPFMVVPDLSTAREVAEKRKQKLQEAALQPRHALKLENLAEQKVAELKVVLKADFRGSIEAIRKELEKLTHEEVRVRLLHAAIGGITESDVQLALASPEDTIIVGFNVVPDERAQSLADERGIQIRQYNIIYNLTNDVRSALEGKLKPREEVIHLGRAVVRETFKISRVGTIAGCYVTQGTIERSAKVRVIRSGVVIYPPPDRTASLESLKRFKEDVREVREGFECGIKVAGYDDIKVDDIIEAYRIEQVQRTLS
jgi:translation initiation factor IF-2